MLPFSSNWSATLLRLETMQKSLFCGHQHSHWCCDPPGEMKRPCFMGHTWSTFKANLQRDNEHQRSCSCLCQRTWENEKTQQMMSKAAQSEIHSFCLKPALWKNQRLAIANDLVFGLCSCLFENNWRWKQPKMLQIISMTPDFFRFWKCFWQLSCHTLQEDHCLTTRVVGNWHWMSTYTTNGGRSNQQNDTSSCWLLVASRRKRPEGFVLECSAPFSNGKAVTCRYEKFEMNLHTVVPSSSDTFQWCKHVCIFFLKNFSHIIFYCKRR